MKNKSLTVLSYFFLLLAAVYIVDGSWIKIKAEVAQVLLKRAWQETVEGGEKVKPWPWADSWPVARLQVERLGIDCIVMEGDSGEVLAFGPGHISESSKPLAEGNCTLVGHRDTSFAFLKELEKGDTLVLQNVKGNRLEYKVVSTLIKKDEDLYLEETVTPWLTLITCFPFDGVRAGTSMRFVVFAKEMSSLFEAV
jgi:sortase A